MTHSPIPLGEVMHCARLSVVWLLLCYEGITPQFCGRGSLWDGGEFQNGTLLLQISPRERTRVQALLIALIFVVAMASPAVLAVRFQTRSRRALPPTHRMVQRYSRSFESSVVGPARVHTNVTVRLGPKLLKAARQAKRLPANTHDRQT